MSDRLHNHLTIGLRPMGECRACDQYRSDMRRIRRADRQQLQPLSA